MEITPRIAELRREAGISQRELAGRVSATLSMIGKLERGERELTSSWIAKLCTALSCAPADLFVKPDEPIHIGTLHSNGIVTGEGAAFDQHGLRASDFEDNKMPRTKNQLRSMALGTGIAALPLPEGSRIVFATRSYLDPVRQNAIYLVSLQGSRAFIARLLPGSKDDLITILPLNAEPLVDVEKPLYWRIIEVKMA